MTGLPAAYPPDMDVERVRQHHAAEQARAREIRAEGYRLLGAAQTLDRAAEAALAVLKWRGSHEVTIGEPHASHLSPNGPLHVDVSCSCGEGGVNFSDAAAAGRWFEDRHLPEVLERRAELTP